MNQLRHLFRDTRGANLVEYMILVGVVAVLALATFKGLGSKVQKTTAEQTKTLDAVNTTSQKP